MTNPHNVDICVTCVSEKPPQLPLREELPSLGIEVIYNAHGVGAKASKYEQKRKLKKYQREKLQTQKKSFFSRLGGQQQREDEENKRREEELRAPHALSYTSYQKRLESQLSRDGLKKFVPRDSSDGSETPSCETDSTAESSNRDNNVDRYTPEGHGSTSRGGNKAPIKNLEIPLYSPEELAIKAAFDVFAGAVPLDGRTTSPNSREAPSPQRPNSSSSNQYSQSSTPSTRSPQSQGEKQSKHNLFVKASTTVRRFMGRPAEQLEPYSNDFVEENGDTPSIESLEEMAAAYLAASPVYSRTEGARSSSLSGDTTVLSERVRGPLINENNNVTEFYDLTAISDEEKQKYQENTSRNSDETTFNHSNDLSTLSSTRHAATEENVAVYPTAPMQERLSGLSFPIPEEDDGYGHIVLDLSDVMEEDGPGSPLVYRGRDSVEDRQDDDIYERSERYGSRSRRDYTFESRTRFRSRANGDDTFSPTYGSPTRRDDAFQTPPRSGSTSKHDDTFGDFANLAERKLALLRGKSLFDDISSLGHPDLKRSTFDSSNRRNYSENSAATYPPRTSYSGDSEINESGHHQGSISSRSRFFLPTASASPKDLDRLPDEMVFTPNLKNSLSKEDESRSKLSVSFSHDIEARYYDEADHGIYDSLVDFENGGLISQSHSDFDANVDQKFDSILKRTRRDGTEKPCKPESRKSQEARLRNALLDNGPVPENAAEIIKRSPRFARQKLQGTDTYPLHAACMLEFPHRFEDNKLCQVRDLVNDIRQRKELILAFLQADAACCTYLDADNNLPVHIIARQLMEWEAKWYQKVYETSRDESTHHGGRGVGITTLYQTMSQIVDVLLKPLAAKEELCQQPGGVGYILPLHIAAIFTVSYDTLKAVIERYPAAASQKCNLEDIRTFIPNFSIPLELHSRLSTDFPKWEIEKHSEPESEIQWTQSKLDRSYGTKGGMQRSDLMFAFFPDVSPYRHETQRIRRLEARIQSEVHDVEARDDEVLSLPVRLVWEWMCTYEGENEEDNYADSVRRIVQSLSAKSVKILAATLNQFGRPIIDGARSECTDAIRERLHEISSTMIPIPIDVLSSGFGSVQRSFILREWEETTASQFCLHSRGFVGVLCRELFNISETGFPSNFVLLPYKLVKDSEGRLGLASAEAASTAMKFADCLLNLTDPSKILHFLEKKSMRFRGVSLGIEASADWDKVEARTKQQVSKLLSLYARGEAYFYLLDEYTGVPIVPEKDALYPLVISDAVDTVRRILPLMMCGMILMRGEKALSVLAGVLLNVNVTTVQEHWINAAKDLIGYLYSPQTEWTKSFLNDLRPLRSQLVEFVERGPSEGAPSIPREGLASEWVVELSLLKMIVEMHDSEHTLSGLRPRRAGNKVLWTQEAAFLDPVSKEHLFQMDFKPLQELKEQSDELDEKMLVKKRHGAEPAAEDDPKSTNANRYDLLFAELSFPSMAGENSESSDKIGDKSEESDDEDDLFIAEPPAIVRQRPRYASALAPISLLTFDDDLDLDEVLRLRILLDEQEAKLDFLREKVEDLQIGEMDLLDGEERISEMLDEINGQKDILMLGSPSKGLSSARKLVHRICDLEDRISMGEVEVGQLKNNVACFALEATKYQGGIYFDDFS